MIQNTVIFEDGDFIVSHNIKPILIGKHSISTKDNLAIRERFEYVTYEDARIDIRYLISFVKSSIIILESEINYSATRLDGIELSKKDKIERIKNSGEILWEIVTKKVNSTLKTQLDFQPLSENDILEQLQKSELRKN